MLRDALGAGVRAVRRAERVVDIQVTELGERARQTLVVRLLAAEEAGVLEQQDLARLQVVRRLEFLFALGLLSVRASAEAGSGELTVTKSKLGGARFQITWPKGSPASNPARADVQKKSSVC